MMLEDEIDLWLRSDIFSNPFPREVGLKRFVAEDDVDFWDYLNSLSWLSGYSNVWSNWQKSRRIFDTVLIDIDDHDKSKNVDEQILGAYEVMGKVYDWSIENELVGRWYFSGRGFHVYFDFEPAHLELYTEVVRYYWAKDEFKSLNGNIDWHVIGNKNAMARVPGTINEKTGFYMVRIDPTWELSKILSNADDGRFVDECDVKRREKNSWLREYFLFLESELKEKNGKYSNKNGNSRDDEVGEFIKRHNNFDNLPPCVREGIELLMETGELTHEWRFHVASYLLRVWDYDEVMRLFMFADDFKYRITKYQLDNILQRGYMPYSCRNAKNVGICPVNNIKKCPFYQLTDGWIGRPFGDRGEL